MNTGQEYRRFDEPPFSEDWLACGINAYIEIFGLPEEKVHSADKEIIANKLVGLLKNSQKLDSECGHAVQLQNLIDMTCDHANIDNDLMLMQIINLSEQKFQYWKERGELI
jgi:hypothetical protein